MFLRQRCRLTYFVTSSRVQCLDEARNVDGKYHVPSSYKMAVMGEACSGSAGTSRYNHTVLQRTTARSVILPLKQEWRVYQNRLAVSEIMKCQFIVALFHEHPRLNYLNYNHPSLS